MNLKRKIIVRCTVSTLLLFFPLLAFAHIGVTPLSCDIEVLPGQKSSVYSFEVIYEEESPEDNPVKMSVFLADWDQDIDGNLKIAPAGTLPRSFASRIDFSPSDFLLNPGQGQKVNFTVNLPPEEKGPHWAMFLVRSDKYVTSEVDIEEKKKLVVKASVFYGVKLRQIDPSTARREGKVVRAEVISSEESDPFLKVVAVFENTGTTFLKVGGRIEFRDEKGETVDTIQVQNFSVLPGAKRKIESNCKKELPLGEYIALVILDFGGDYLVAGQVNFKRSL